MEKVQMEKLVPIPSTTIEKKLMDISQKEKTSFIKILGIFNIKFLSEEIICSSLVPPTKVCLMCDREHKLANDPIHVALMTENGPVPALKYSYR